MDKFILLKLVGRIRDDAAQMHRKAGRFSQSLRCLQYIWVRDSVCTT